MLNYVVHFEVLYMLAAFLQKHKFDGMVLEVWSQLGGHYKRYTCICDCACINLMPQNLNSEK